MTDGTEGARPEPETDDETRRGRSRRRSGADQEPAPPSVRPQSYLIGHTREPLSGGLKPLNLQLFAQKLPDLEDITITRTLNPSPALAGLGLFSAVPAESEQILVAEIPAEKAEILQRNPALIVEPNRPLDLPQSPILEGTGRNPGVLWPQATQFQVTVRVRSTDGDPLEGVEVLIFGSKQHGGLTNAQGEVQVTIFGETPSTINGLYTKPRAGYWERWIQQPALVPGATYDVSLQPLSTVFQDFPDQEVSGWGWAAMKLDKLDPDQFDGDGIKVGIIDSGAASSHPDLDQRVETGFSIVDDREQGWEDDVIAHGTHVAGVIAGNADGSGIRGVAPKARLFIYKIFPGGLDDHLISALDRCIDDEVDVVNLSLGTDVGNRFVEERLQAAKNRGIACIVAAGNTAGPVRFPAVSRHVLAVAAIGKAGEFPPDTYHATQPVATNGSDGYFAAKFSCHGREIGVTAPGVAILSSVPGEGFAAWDGTSMATPYVVGLAALVLAHHPDFQRAPFNQRNATRVDRLFQILKQTAQPLNLGQDRTGAGLPDAERALTVTLGDAPPPAARSRVDSLLERARQNGIRV